MKLLAVKLRVPACGVRDTNPYGSLHKPRVTKMSVTANQYCQTLKKGATSGAVIPWL